MIRFEVGKFYAVNMTSFSSKKVSSMCVRTTKCTVSFQCLYKSGDKLRYLVKKRRKYETNDGRECAYCPEKWSGISSTFSDELREKPKGWEKAEGGAK